MFLLESWPGRILCGALGLFVLDNFLYVPLPCGLEVLYKLCLALLFCWFTFRLGRYLVKRLLWRIRTKMIAAVALASFHGSAAVEITLATRLAARGSRALSDSRFGHSKSLRCRHARSAVHARDQTMLPPSICRTNWPPGIEA